MAVFMLLVVAVMTAIVMVKIRNGEKRRAFEATAEADPLHPTISAVLRTAGDWRSQRAAHAAVRSQTGSIVTIVERYGESLLLVVHSSDSPFGGLLAVTQGRTVLFSNGFAVEIEHRHATTEIVSTGQNGNSWVEVRHGGREIRFSAGSPRECQLVCALVDLWAENPDVAPDRRVRIGAAGIEIDDALYGETLRRTGHPVTPFNLRSIHERFGMQLHMKAVQYIAANHGQAAEQRFLAAAARPSDDRDLPGWPIRVLREWSSFDTGIAPVASFFPLWVQHLLLDTARTGGYLAHPERPLSMWKNDQYDDGGRGLRPIDARLNRHSTARTRSPVAFIVVLILVIIVGTAYSIYNTVSAKQAVDLEVAGTRQELLIRANSYFGRTWTRVDGPGDLNVEPALRVKPATLSVSVIELRPGTCGVSIWTSSWNSRYGLMGHAQLARRKKNGLAAALASSRSIAA